MRPDAVEAVSRTMIMKESISMKATRIPQLLVASLLCAGLLAGCGGALSKADYEKEATAIGKEVDKEFNALDGDEAPTQKQFDESVKALRTAADDLDELSPPEEIADLHDDLVDTLREAADVFEESGGDLLKMMENPEDADPADAEKLQADFEKIGTKMEEVQEGYEKKKYDIGFDD